MKIGLYVVLNEATMSVPALARAAEERGFDSIWVPEHSHIPTTGNTPYPGRGPVTPDFARTFDPFAVLAAAASVTSTIKLATGICLLIQRDTIHTAKTIATLDHLSGGRIVFGVGGGWNRPEMENHGTDYATRFKRLDEQIDALKAIWTKDEAEYHGRFVEFGPMWCWPKPMTKPHPPIYVGGETDHTLARIVARGDGWLPRVRDPDKVLRGIGRLRALAKAAGRNPDSIGVSAFGLPAREEAIAPFREAGIERAILAVTPGPAEDMLRRLDRYAELVGA
jgi:probable F420-dependent oxidoreductase